MSAVELSKYASGEGIWWDGAGVGLEAVETDVTMDGNLYGVVQGAAAVN